MRAISDHRELPFWGGGLCHLGIVSFGVTKETDDSDVDFSIQLEQSPWGRIEPF